MPNDHQAYALHLLSTREHSTAELEKKLKKRFPEVDEKEIQEMIKDFIQKGWISNERYCESFIHDRILSTRSGPNKIKLQLINKGIKNELAEAMLTQHYSPEHQLEVATPLAEKKRTELERRGKVKSEYEMKGKIVQYLLGKGFGIEVATKAVTV